jgi:hypothetical protein
MRWAVPVARTAKDKMPVFLWQKLKNGDGFVGLGVVERIILKRIIMKYVRGWTGCICFRIGICDGLL